VSSKQVGLKNEHVLKMYPRPLRGKPHHLNFIQGVWSCWEFQRVKNGTRFFLFSQLARFGSIICHKQLQKTEKRFC
jgi:hypothetical protein